MMNTKHSVFVILTPWPVYDIFILGFRSKKQQFSVALPMP